MKYAVPDIWTCKVSLFLYTPWRHTGGVEVWLHSFLNLGTRCRWMFNLTLRLFYLRKAHRVPTLSLHNIELSQRDARLQSLQEGKYFNHDWSMVNAFCTVELKLRSGRIHITQDQNIYNTVRTTDLKFDLIWNFAPESQLVMRLFKQTKFTFN